MNDLDRYLLPTETTEVVVRRHWASQVRNAGIALGLVVLALLMLMYLAEAQFFSLLGTVLLLGTLGWFAWVVGDWYAERFVITDKRVLLITGLLTKRVAIMPLSKVTDLTYERPVIGRILGYGVFVVESAGQHQALSRIDYLPHPDELYQQVSALLFGPRRNDRRDDRDDRDGGSGNRRRDESIFARGPDYPDRTTDPRDPDYRGVGRTDRLPGPPGASGAGSSGVTGGYVGGQAQDQSTTPLPRFR